MFCGFCDSESHESRDCPAVAVIQRSESYAEGEDAAREDAVSSETARKR